MDDDKLYDMSKHVATLTLTLLALLVLFFKTDYSPKGHDYILYVIGVALLLAFTSACYAAYKTVVKDTSNSIVKYLRFSLILMISCIYATVIKIGAIA